MRRHLFERCLDIVKIIQIAKRVGKTGNRIILFQAVQIVHIALYQRHWYLRFLGMLKGQTQHLF